MATDIKFNTYSSKPSMLTTGVQYGVNEMAETALSMGFQTGRRTIVEGVTKDIENEFLNDVVQDGLSAGLGYFSGQIMQMQDKVLEGIFRSGSAIVGAWYVKSSAANYFKSLKGTKLKLFSRFMGDNDKKAEECRLIADFVKIDADTTANSHNPLAQQNAIQAKYRHESLEVNKEGVRSGLAKLQIDGLRDTFEMKLRTSSFFNTDKDLIRKMTGMTIVTDKEIKKLNALSSSQVFQDSEGNWVGGNQAMIELMSGLRLHRA